MSQIARFEGGVSSGTEKSMGASRRERALELERAGCVLALSLFGSVTDLSQGLWLPRWAAWSMEHCIYGQDITY